MHRTHAKAMELAGEGSGLMKVLVNAMCRGGIGRYGTLLARALSHRDDVVVRALVSDEVAASSVFGPVCREISASSVPISPGLGKLFALKKLRSEVATFKPDIVHDTSGCSGPLAPFSWRMHPGGARLILTEHDVVPHYMMGNTMMKRLSRRVSETWPDHVLVHGRTSYELFANRLAARRRRLSVSVIPHGELGIFAANDRSVARKAKRILFFGALRPNKGVDWLMDIADIVRESHPDATFLVAGSSRLSKEFRKSGWNEELSRILFRMQRRSDFDVRDEFIPDDSVGDLFLESGVCVLPYRDATASGVAAIALPLGSVVVGTRVGDLPEQLMNGKAGVLVEPGPRTIAEGIIDLLDSPDYAEKLRATALRHAKGELAWDAIADQHVKCYQGVTG